MNFLSTLKMKIFKYTIAGTLVFSLVFLPISQTLEIKHVEAQEIVFDPIGYIGTFGTYIKTAWSAVSDAATASGIGSIAVKENFLDGIAWQIINITLKEMVRSVTKWVNSGFKGSPAFVTDLQGFMTDVADKIAGNFIWGNESLRFLCSPYSLNIKLALDIQYRATRAYEAQCTISGIIKNTDQFLAGDFLQGGWNGWYEVALNPQNNIYGSMLQAQQGLSASIGSAQIAERGLLDFGNGFLSVRDPNCKANPDSPDDFDESRCGVVTPGAVVEGQLNNVLGSGQRRIELADEINELVGALFSQLAGQALSGAGGLLGLTESGYSGGRGNYFDQISAERATLGYNNPSTQNFESAINDETKYQNFQKTIVTLIIDASTYKERRYPEPEDEDGNNNRRRACSTGELTSSLSQQLSRAQHEVASSTSLIANLQVFQNDYTTLRNSATSPSITNQLLTKYNASTVPDAEGILMGRYLAYQSSGALHTAGDSINLELSTIPALQKEVQAFTDTIDEDCGPNSND